MPRSPLANSERNAYLAISGVSAIFGIAVFTLLQSVSANGQMQGAELYAGLLILGMSAGAFFFGVFKSFAKLNGKYLGINIELGGPVVLAVLVVYGGIRFIQQIPMTRLAIRVLDENNEPITSGTLHIFKDGFDTSVSLNDKGSATYADVPSDLIARDVEYTLKSSDYVLTSPQHQALPNGTLELHVRKSAGPIMREIWVATLTSGDLAYTRDILSSFHDRLSSDLAKRGTGLRLYSTTGPATPLSDPSCASAWKDRVQDILGRNDFDYVVAIGTQASLALKRYMGSRYQTANIIDIGVTDPVGIGVVTSYTNRNEAMNIAAVAYMGRPEDYASQLYALFPGRSFVYLYERGFPQDETIGNRLALTAAAQSGQLRVEAVNHLPTLADFGDDRKVYFSWYTFEVMFESGRSLEILKQRLVATSTMDNVETDDLAAVGVSSSDKEIGQDGADLLIDDLSGARHLRNADVLVPPLHHWVNCRNAARLQLALTDEIIRSADETFECK
jgi:hypothetical protein